MTDSPFEWLQSWYRSKLDGDWEHQNGIRISTIDNPGWRLTVDIWDTELGERSFDRREEERGKHDWVSAWVEHGKFEACGGPDSLPEMISIFRDWVERS